MPRPYILLWGVPGAAHRELENLGAVSRGDYWWLYPPLEPDLEHLCQQQAGFAERAAQLSEKLHCTALAVMNLEDAALLPAPAGFPVRLRHVPGLPGESVDGLCRQQALRAWLVRRRSLGFLSERERLEKILALLELPTSTPQ